MGLPAHYTPLVGSDKLRGRQLFTQVTNAIQGKQTVNPRTVLGFYATVLGILLSGTFAAVLTLAANNVRVDLIPWLLGFAGIVFVLLIAGVFAVTLIDPSKLMLTQVTGTEYAAIHRTIIGDSLTGRRIITRGDDAMLVDAQVIDSNDLAEPAVIETAIIDDEISEVPQ